MQKLQDYWNDRTAQQRLTLLAAFFVTFLGVGGFAWYANRTPVSLLYGGLDGTQSGAIIAEVEKAGVAYEVRGDSIWVDAAQRDRLRMTLAGQGLPNSGSAGYEILDGMSGFGTTSQMFDAAYWRAKEGELARTILALPNVKAARVHLAVPTTRGYRRENSGSASVTLTTSGTPISRAQAQSLRFLISSGVAGLPADKVTVIDTLRGVVSAGDAPSGADRETEMKRNVERILEPHVGVGNAIVELALTVQTEAEQVTEQRFDPKERALISQESEETTDQSTNQGAAVTASSNLPEGQGQGGDQSKTASSGTRQRSNYEVSKVTREVVRQPGDIKRLTVAVLVNGVPQQDAGGDTVLVPRSEVEIQALRELVASAVGFDEDRGDVITLKSMPFAALSDEGTLAQRGGWLDRLELNALAKLGLVGLFALLIATLVVRPALRLRPGRAAPLLDDSVGGGPGALPALGAPPMQSTGDQVLPALAMSVPEYDFDVQTPGSADPVARLRELMKERQQDSLRILSNWIDEKGNA